MTESFPLYWPEGRPRTGQGKRQRSKFSTGFGAAVNLVVAELRRLGATHSVVSTNVALRRDGLPLASAKRVDDTGAAVYFMYKGKQVCFACDRWDKVEDNIYAIAKTIDAMRGIARWGTGDMLDAAFNGFAALPSPNSKRTWRHSLGFAPDSKPSIDFVEQQYRSLAKEHHPDSANGNVERMVEINAAIKAAREELTA